MNSRTASSGGQLSTGSNLRRLRNARGLSQDDLAYEAKISRSYLSQIEKGVFFASLKVIGKCDCNARCKRKRIISHGSRVFRGSDFKIVSAPPESFQWGEIGFLGHVHSEGMRDENLRHEVGSQEFYSAQTDI